MFICPGHPLSVFGAATLHTPADRLSSSTDALTVINSVIDRPLTPQTIVLPLDAERRGHKIIVIHDTTSAESVLDVVEAVVLAGRSTQCSALVIASVRPTGHTVGHDSERWIELDELTASAEIRLIEWFVIAGDGVNRPRDLLGIEPRW